MREPLHARMQGLMMVCVGNTGKNDGRFDTHPRFAVDGICSFPAGIDVVTSQAAVENAQAGRTILGIGHHVIL